MLILIFLYLVVDILKRCPITLVSINVTVVGPRKQRLSFSLTIKKE